MPRVGMSVAVKSQEVQVSGTALVEQEAPLVSQFVTFPIALTVPSICTLQEQGSVIPWCAWEVASPSEAIALGINRVPFLPLRPCLERFTTSKSSPFHRKRALTRLKLAPLVLWESELVNEQIFSQQLKQSFIFSHSFCTEVHVATGVPGSS